MSAPKASRPARDRQFASTLAHGLQLLRCFTPEAAVLSNRQLSELSGLSKPTVSRYTYTLIELGYLKVDPVSGKFQLGNAVLTLSYPLLANIALRQVVRSPMRELAERLGCSVSLCMRERLSMVYVETSRSRSLRAQPLRHRHVAPHHRHVQWPRLSRRVQRGRAQYAVQPDPCEDARALGALGRIGAGHDPVLGRHGFCYSHGEYRPDVATVGVPYRPSSGGELYVFNCVLGSQFVKPGQLENEVGPALLEMTSVLPYA